MESCYCASAFQTINHFIPPGIHSLWIFLFHAAILQHLRANMRPIYILTLANSVYPCTQI